MLRNRAYRHLIIIRYKSVIDPLEKQYFISKVLIPELVAETEEIAKKLDKHISNQLMFWSKFSFNFYNYMWNFEEY